MTADQKPAVEPVAMPIITPDELRGIARYACFDSFGDCYTSDPETHPAWRAAALLEQALAERGDMLGKLQDPEAVHMNMLRGVVAKLSFAQVEHLGYPEIVELRAEKARADALAEQAKTLREAVDAIHSWAEQRCPCRNEEPDPCPLCGASVENLEACKSAESTLPRHLLEMIRRARARSLSTTPTGTDAAS